MPSPSPRRSLWASARRQWRRLYVRVVRAPGEPRDIALGVAIGVWCSMIPLMQMFLAVGVAGFVRRFTTRRPSYIAAAAGTWVTNPLTYGPVYALSTVVGKPIAGPILHALGAASPGPGNWFSGPAILETSLSFVLGAILVGTPASFVAYELTRRFVATYQARRIARQRARALRAIGAEHLLDDAARVASGS